MATDENGHVSPTMEIEATDYFKKALEANAKRKRDAKQPAPTEDKLPAPVPDATESDDEAEPGGNDKPEAVSKMVARARKNARNVKPSSRKRPFDGLRLWPWLLAPTKLRKAIWARYGDILNEWREGLTVVVSNEKGGSSKTSVAVMVWLLLAWILDKTIVLLNFNPAGDHARKRGGVGETATMAQFWFDKDFGPIVSHQALSEQVGTHPVYRNAYMIDWISNKFDYLEKPKKRLTEEPTTDAMGTVLETVDCASHSQVIDMGNPLTGTWYQTPVTYDPERSVLVVTFMLDQDFSEDGAVNTIDAHVEADPTSRDRIVLVVMNYKHTGSWWKSLWPNYRRRIRNEQIDRLSKADGIGIPSNRIVVVPHDDAFNSTGAIDPETGKKLPRVLDPRQLRLRTLAAGMRLLLVIARTSREYRELNPQQEGK